MQEIQNMFLSRGFAFVTFKDPSSVQAVIEQNNNGGHTLDGKVVSFVNFNVKFLLQATEKTSCKYFCFVFILILSNSEEC